MSKSSPQWNLKSLAESYADLLVKRKVALEGLEGPSLAACAMDFAETSGKPVVLVCPNELDALKIVQDLRFFAGDPTEEPDFMGEYRVLFLPVDETTPYEGRKRLADRVRRREMLSALYLMTQPFRPKVLVTTSHALSRLTIPRKEFEAGCEFLLAGAETPRDEFVRKLTESGYVGAPLVEDPGSFAVRGGIVDVFSPLYRLPLRLEYWGDTVESIRLFDPRTQKSRKHLEEAHIVPVREIVLSDDCALTGRIRIEEIAHAQKMLDRALLTRLEELEEGICAPEMEVYLPLFYRELSSVFDYFPPGPVMMLPQPRQLDHLLEMENERLQEQYENDVEQASDLVLEPERYYFRPLDVWTKIGRRPHVLVNSEDFKDSAGALDRDEAPPQRFSSEDHTKLKAEIAARRGHEGVMAPLLSRLEFWGERNYHVFLVSRTERRLQRLADMLETRGVRTSSWDATLPEVRKKLGETGFETLHGLVGELSAGQVWPLERLVMISEEEVFGETRQKRRRPSSELSPDALIESFEELSIGDYVVHVEYGVGIYRGLMQLEAGGSATDCLEIEYLGKDRLYLPVHRLDKVQKYSGGENAIPTLDRMGGSRWGKLKSKVKGEILKLATELLELYAKRQAFEGHAFSPPDEIFDRFEATFPYDETHDQERTIREVIEDMCKPRPMDRLVCGDVGFGKTEVAMRAALKAVLDGKQVAVLVPTTVLALQHFQSFIDRFKNFPVTVNMVSRMRSSAETRNILDRLRRGQIDILIGTHRLLSKDIQFHDLGLLIVDEEQRFGVQQKEKIKQWRSNVDVLAMSATPIPRTLNMSISGVRDLSVIQTPPADRLAIRTFVHKFDEETIREAVRQELARGGQVYFLHNRVQSIDNMVRLVRRLVPEAKVAMGHGQMKEGELEKIMLDFVAHKTNVLVATTIIESGIDIPSVNTIIINRADHFGLSQLYQLRGRVGRSQNRAYAYLLVPSVTALTPDARKRLAVLMRFTELGSGFRIAAHDMEIRGAGSLLGKDQSGHIGAVGLSLYMEMLKEAVAELKGEPSANVVEPEINVDIPANLPQEYVNDAAERFRLYKRLSRADSDDAIDILFDELKDRFGRPPAEAENLGRIVRLKARLRGINAKGMDVGTGGLVLNMGEYCSLDPTALVQFVAKHPTYTLTPDMRLKMLFPRREQSRRPLDIARILLDELLEQMVP